MEQSIPRPRRWTREEYDRLIDQGTFGPEERLELVNGEILAMTPQKSLHTTAVHLVHEALRQAFLPPAHVRLQSPIALDPASEPEPDLLVVPGGIRDYAAVHPKTGLLVVEVAESSLTYDRQTKRPLYARAGIPEYWIVNLVDRVLEVYREPEERDGQWDYRLVQWLNPGDPICPMAAADAVFPVSTLLP